MSKSAELEAALKEGLPMLPQSGARGTRKLGVLFRRAEHLRARIEKPRSQRFRSWDATELAAIAWAIEWIFELESTLTAHNIVMPPLARTRTHLDT